MSNLTKRLAALTPEKREMFLRQMRRQEQGDQEGIPSRLGERDTFPLSFAQQRLWFLNQLEPQSPFYNMSSAFHLQGQLDVQALEESLTEIVQRHEMLRTTFRMQDEEPIQVIAPLAQVQMPVIDLAGMNFKEREKHSLALLQEEALYPFQLSVGSLFRLCLLRLEEQEHILVLTMHHIISDGWSMGVLIRELATLYHAKAEHKPASLPSLPIQYADYALWQRQWLQGEILQTQLAYWQRQLADAPALLNLPLDHPRPPIQSFVGSRQQLLLSTELQQQLNALSQSEGVTLFMTLLAALQILLMRYSGQEDIVVGTPIANRTRQELKGLVGFFVNTLALRTDLSKASSFLDFLARVREVTLQAYAHQDLPFERILEALQIERTLSHAPLFQVLFALQNMPLPEIQLDKLILQPVTLTHVTTKFDLSVIIHETSRGLLTEIEYNTDLFAAATIQGLLEHWQVLLAGIVAEPQRRLSALPILTVAEEHTLLTNWNQTVPERGVEQGLHQLFEAQAQHAPDRVALVFENQQLTYGELKQRANQIASSLRRMGVTTESLVGVFMERSLELVIALLGIFKAGGTYVPLDPTAPVKRLQWMIEDIQPTVILSQSRLQAEVLFPERTVLCLDTDENIWTHEPTSLPEESGASEHLAYVIYTSGSTGQPKGVMVTHQAIGNSLQWMQSAFQLQPADSMLQHTPVTFDASLWELVWPLLAGARIILSPPDAQRDGAEICALLAEQSITTVFFVPTLLRAVLEEPAFGHCSNIRQVLCGGEALALDLLQRFRACHPALLYNLYGPTEAAIQVTWQRVEPEEVAEVIPIGRAIAHVNLSVLDTHGSLVPIGVVGELCIGGENLARGYLGRADLTAERFVPDPWSQQPGARLYRTGDLVRYRADGVLEYVGRLDDQVKVHGVRIELGEIQAVLNQHPAVQESLVLLTDEATRDGQLVAYMLGEQHPTQAEQGARGFFAGPSIFPSLPQAGGEAPAEQGVNPEPRLWIDPGSLSLASMTPPRGDEASPSSPLQESRAYPAEQTGENATWESDQEIRRWVSERLPASMQPTYYVFMTEWPLKSNGKIDRSALPSVHAEQREQSAVPVLPATPTERILMDLWSKALGREQMSIHDNFFHLGGDSIVSIQIVAKARQAGLQLTLKQIFQHQTIAQLATVVTMTNSLEPEEEEVAGLVPLTPIQHWFFEQNLPQPAHFNQAVLLQIPLAWSISHLQQAVNALLLQHAVLRYRYEQTASGWQQRLLTVEEASPVRVERIDLSLVPQSEQRYVLELQANRVQASLNLQQGPLWRCVYFDLGVEQAPRLLLVIHHLLIDGVSWRVLLEDLQVAMICLQEETVVQLPARTASFQRWVHYLHSIANGEQIRQERAYWLAAAQQRTDSLPFGNVAEANLPPATGNVSVGLTQEETHQLLHEALATYHSQTQELLLTALLQSLADWAGVRSLSIDMEGHGREEIDGEGLDISRTAGWFTSLYPVLFRLPEAQVTAGVWIKTIKEQIRAVPNKGIGYGLLRYLSDDHEVVEQLQAASRPQVSFNYLGQFDQVFGDQKRSGESLQPAHESAGAASAAENPRSHLLEVNALVAQAQLHLTLTYNKQVYVHETMEALARNVLSKLKQLLRHCLSLQADANEARYTPSDFPLAQLTQDQLDCVLTNRRNVEDIYPLTPMQQGILFHTLYAPQSGVYVEQMSCVIDNLNQSLFMQAWQYFISQTAILRTSFAWENLAEPLQLVEAQTKLPLNTLDWSDRAREQQELDLEAFLQADRLRGFDLQQAPLMRLTFILLSESKTLVLWSHHHLLLDGWSMGMLIREVLACYVALLRGEVPRMEQRRPYRDYVAWLRQQEGGQAETYWRQYLAGFLSPTSLGIEQRKVEKAGELHQPQYTNEKLVFSQEVSLRWRKAARDQQITLNTLIQGAWALVLACYSGQQEVVFGNVVAGRPPELAGMERILGLFINTVPVRIQVETTRTVRSWLQQLQEQQVEQRQYEYTPLVQVQGWSEVPRDQPLFESLLSFDNYPVETVSPEQSAHLQVEAIQVKTQTHYPLTLVIVDSAEISLRMSYNRQQFDTRTIQRLLLHLQTIIEQLASQPGQRLDTLSLLPPHERQQMLIEANQTQRDYDYIRLVHTRFEEQVECTPDAIALFFEEHALTYADLNQRANQLAHTLRKRGVGPDVCVGLYMERSLELIIGVLGVLKSGGVYVPLDPTLPTERLLWMIEDAQPALVITQSKQPLTSLFSLTPLLCLDDDWESIASEPASNPVNIATGLNLAYVLYTSGSTGKPKGVMVEHRNLLNYVLTVRERAEITGPGIFVMLQPLSVDSSITMLFSSLTVGGVLYLIGREQALDSWWLVALLARYPADYLKIAPSHLATLIQTSGTEHLLPQRCLIIGGESSQLDWAQTLQSAMLANATLFNNYGPTETTVGSTMYQVGPERPAESGKITPVGQALANTQIYVLNAHMQPVPMGVIGEAYIGGTGLTRGYLRRPDLTAALFVPHPFSTEPGERLYRTGDLVRMRTDGILEFAGRADDQVKIRGYRIELGEIEAVLLSHVHIRDAVVIAQQVPAGGKRLVAFLVAQKNAAVSIAEVQQFLRTQLPEPMLPSVFHWLDALPLTPHGKVNRLALHVFTSVEAEIPVQVVAPRNATEEILAEIWLQVLKPPQVSIYDNFFDLGGHSLLVTQILSRIRSAFQIEIPLRSLFEAQTIAELAQVIEQAQNTLINQNKTEDVMDILDALEGLSEDELQALLTVENSEE